MTRAITWSRPTDSREGWYTQHCCPACGQVNDTGELCPNETTCKLCGAVQCSKASARCRMCGWGLLNGYYQSDGPCDYKGCEAERVAYGKGQKRYVCQKHFERQAK